MCFNVDYDWSPAVQGDWTETTGKRRCDECHLEIADGETSHHVYQQEHEECQACYDGECDCVPDSERENHGPEDCKCSSPQYGHEFDYCRCDDCDKFLKAVERAELEAGCSSMEALPPYGEMIEYIGRANGDMASAKRYFKAALKMFPETRGHLAWLWGLMF